MTTSTLDGSAFDANTPDEVARRTRASVLVLRRLNAWAINVPLCGWLLIETMTGHSLSEGTALATGLAMFKVGFFAVVCVTLLRDRAGLVLLLGLVGLLAASLAVQNALGQVDVRTFEIVIKLQLPILAAGAILVVNGTHASAWCRRIVVSNAVILVANLVAGMLGWGLATYETEQGDAFGSTGYFFAGNEVSGAILFCLPALMIFYRDSLWRLLLSVGAMVFAASVLLSRASIVGTLTVGAAFLVRRSVAAAGMVGVVSVAMAVRFSDLLSLAFNAAWTRWIFLGSEFGWRTFLLGGYKRISAIGVYVNDVRARPWTFVTGTGWDGGIENNVFDLAQAFGLFGILILAAWVGLLFPGLLRRLMHRRPIATSPWPFTVASVLLLVTLSAAGHVVQSTLVIPFASVYFARNLELMSRG